MSACLHDSRARERIPHEVATLLRQRLCAIALGYEDANDAAFPARDPALKNMVGRLPESGPDLASQPTLSRFENGVRATELYRFSETLVDLYLETHPGPRKAVVIDLDGTDDPAHGRLQGRRTSGDGHLNPRYRRSLSIDSLFPDWGIDQRTSRKFSLNGVHFLLL